MTSVFLICVIILILTSSQSDCLLFVVPEDVAMGFTTYFGFAPRIFKGNDHRVGFGFRFGNHADLQVLYEFGPQTSTKALKQISVPGGPQRRREVRFPIIELLFRTGVLKRIAYMNNIIHDMTESIKKS